jgi:hypothetical protein
MLLAAAIGAETGPAGATEIISQHDRSTLQPPAETVSMQAGWDTLQTIFALVLAILAATMSTGPVIRREVSDYLLVVLDPASADLDGVGGYPVIPGLP